MKIIKNLKKFKILLKKEKKKKKRHHDESNTNTKNCFDKFGKFDQIIPQKIKNCE